MAEADSRGFYHQIGEGESHGAEVELAARLMKGLAVHGGYAWTRTEITRETGGFVGRELPNAPRHKSNVWVRYRFPEGRLAALTVACGIVHVSDRFTGRDNVVIAPTYTRVDAAASYELAGPAGPDRRESHQPSLRHVWRRTRALRWSSSSNRDPAHLCILTGPAFNARPMERPSMSPKWNDGRLRIC